MLIAVCLVLDRSRAGFGKNDVPTFVVVPVAGLPRSGVTARWNEMRVKLERAPRDWNGWSGILER